ncbi:MAG: hypothetical protein KBT87_00445 [Gammaproteobacteria bacterium]|nr:hypothetical protein [Gammaproteobacteria bacterium]MBQ0773122.1 hypothetical protein [Gammaproteobacteria bacterium]
MQKTFLQAVRALAFAVMTIAMMAGCASTTQLVSVEKSDDAKAPYKKVMVLAITDNGQIRQVIEQGLAAELESAGVRNVVASLSMPGGLDKDKPEAIRALAESAVKENGADAVLVVSLLSAEVREDYVPPQKEIAAMSVTPYYMGYGAYIGYNYQTMYTPGYFVKEQAYYVQSNLFDVSTEKSVWKAQSETINPKDVQSGVLVFSQAIIGQLKADSMVSGSKAPMSRAKSY